MVGAVACRAGGAESRALGATDCSTGSLTMAWVAAETAYGLLVGELLELGGLPSVWGGLVPGCGCLWSAGPGMWCGWALVAAEQGVLEVRAVLEGVRRGGCCDGDRGPLTSGPHLDETGSTVMAWLVSLRRSS